MFKKIICTILVAAALIQISAPDAHARTGRRAAKKVAGCSRIVPLGRIIWKGCAASGHLSGDPRQQGVALIAPRGGTNINPPSCIGILNSTGKRIGGMSLYPGNNGVVYKWRAYSNFGCGSGLTQRGLQSKSGGKQIYLQVGGGQCIMIPKAFSNINSSQRC